MVHLPVRKCFHVAKVGVVLLLVFSILVMVERWRGGKRTARAQEFDPPEADYERQILADEARIVPGLGEGGVAAQLEGRDKELGEESEKKLAINVYLSDRIAYNRTLRDHRNPACRRVVYDAELPSVSVIIIFHNEPYSVVIRTIWSVINSARRDQPWYKKANFVDRETGRTMTLGYPGQDPNSPFVYLKEIILVDDNSTLPELKGKLSHYIRTRLPPDLIRILRLPDRGGLTQARLAGSRLGVGDVLLFLDAHCEGSEDWLRPLLQRIKENRTAVVTPLIDMIHKDTMAYESGDEELFEGLMLARIRGARSARGDVLIFLDAHCEAGPDWLRPLLQRIRDKRDAVITPLIDVIDQSSFELEAAEEFQIGGFNFMGHFTWIDVPEREKKRRGSDIGATWSPTMAGGLFAINREYYWEIGAYDEQMAGWGGENLEMSFRIWQCGGTLETIPCSRVGHVFRAFHPYGLPAHTDTHGINTARMAEVWMDDYKELFYLHRPDLRNNPKIGDVTHRKILREKLQCKNFEWYLQNIYKEKFVPVRDAIGYGRFRNPASGLCLDTLQREAEAAPLGVYPCHPTLQGTQYLSLALNGQIRDEERCVQLQYMRELDSGRNDGRKLLMVNCNKKLHDEKWRYTSKKQLIHSGSGLCLDSGFEGGADVMAVKCRSGAPTQRWEIDYSEHNGFRLSQDREPSETELILQKLRGQRRISRSLMSFGEGDNGTALPKRRRHSHKRRHRKNRKHNKSKRARLRTKNKFILKLVRTLLNNSDEHLEVDIHCKHKQLYPNNSFVRDLVTILNEKNIKVINNGRVFERNRVTELVRDPTTMRQKEAKVLKKLELEQQTPASAQHPVPDIIPPVQREGPMFSPGSDRWMGKKRKMKVAQMPTAGGMQGVNAVNAALEQVSVMYKPQDINDASADKKIIIEDFVEIKPVTTKPVQQRAQPSRPRFKKHKRIHHLTPPPVPRPQPRNTRVSARAQAGGGAGAGEKAPVKFAAEDHSSFEEYPVASREQESNAVLRARTGSSGSDQDRGSGQESEWTGGNDDISKWPPGNYTSTSRRRNDEKQDRLLQTTEAAEDSDSSESQVDARPEPQIEGSKEYNTSALRSRHEDDRDTAPLKVVMKSNLTFNLGDEFFKWRTSDDVSEILGELVIPSNASSRVPPVHAWVKPLQQKRGSQKATSQTFKSTPEELELRSLDNPITKNRGHPKLSTEKGGSGGTRGGGNSIQASAADDSSGSYSESEERRPTTTSGFRRVALPNECTAVRERYPPPASLTTWLGHGLGRGGEGTPYKFQLQKIAPGPIQKSSNEHVRRAREEGSGPQRVYGSWGPLPSPRAPLTLHDCSV